MQGIVAKPELVHLAGLEALNQDVGVLRQLLQRLHSLGGLEIDCNASFVGVQEQKDAALLRVRNVLREWAEGSCVVTRPWLLHLNHVGAEVRQQLGAVRTGNAVGQVYYSKAGEWLCVLVFLHR